MVKFNNQLNTIIWIHVMLLTVKQVFDVVLLSVNIKIKEG